MTTRIINQQEVYFFENYTELLDIEKQIREGLPGELVLVSTKNGVDTFLMFNSDTKGCPKSIKHVHQRWAIFMSIYGTPYNKEVIKSLAKDGAHFFKHGVIDERIGFIPRAN